MNKTKFLLIILMIMSFVSGSWATEVSVLGSLGTNQYYNIGTSTTFTTSYSSSSWFLLGFTANNETYYVYYSGDKASTTASETKWAVTAASDLNLTSDNYWRYAFNIRSLRLGICTGTSFDTSTTWGTGRFIYINGTTLESYYNNGGTLWATSSAGNGYLTNPNGVYWIAGASTGLSIVTSKSSATQFTIYPLTIATMPTVTCTTPATAAGTLSVDKTAATPGQTVTVTASINTGYQLKVVDGSGNAVTTTAGSNNTYTFTMPSTNVTVSLEAINYTITCSTVTGGTVSANATTATYGSTVTLSNSPSSGYTFSSYSVIYTDGDGKQQTVTVSSDGTFSMPAYNVTVYADFTDQSALYKRTVYSKTSASYPYRIPALTQNQSGKLIAIADYRPSGVDIGSGEVDLVAKTSDDAGSTWSSTATTFANGDGGTDTGSYGYGDAAVVADRESNNVLAMSCYATKGNNFFSGGLQSARMTSSDGGSTWGTPTTISASSMASLVGVSGAGVFFSSGKILQSQYTKVGSYYRIYAALCATQSATTSSSIVYKTSTWVVYSDDFGANWSVLGGTSAAPVVNGNEAKVEELPDGRIVVSSRVNDNAGVSSGNSGRYFNIFTYTDTENAVGSWGTAVKNTTIAASDGQGTNGEILIVPAKDASNNDVYVALQSAPAGGTEGNRSHVSVYYKVLDAYANFKDVSTFATGWTLSKELSSTTSAYSTMILQQDGNIGLLYEENSYNGGYDIIYNKFALSELAGGYTLNTSIDRKTFVTNYFTAYEETQTSWGSDVKAEYEGLVDALADGITTAELDAIYSFIANPVVNYDGKTVTLAVKGYTSSTSSTFTEYLYDNSTTLTATTTAPTDATISTYEFVMHAGSNGGYTFQSVSNPTLYLGISGTTSDNICLSTNATEFTLTKNANYSTGYTSVDMDGYALAYTRVNTATVGAGILVAVSNAQGIDKLNYTVKNWTSNNSTYFSTDFTLTVIETGHKVTCSTATNGSVSATPNTNVASGATVTLTATPATGYELDAYTVTKTGDETTTVTVTDGTFTMPDYDVTVSATFKAKSYTITCSATNGTLTADKATATAGETVTLTLAPSTGYVLNELKVFNTTEEGYFAAESQSDGTYTFTMPTSNVEASAIYLDWTTDGTNTFHLNTWSVEGNSDGTGMTTPFIESWVGANNTLPNQTISYVTTSGYTPGYYEVSILARMYNEGNTTDALSGTATFNANSSSVDMLSTGTSFTYNSASNGVYGTYKVIAQVGEDGILNINFNLSGVNFDWIAFKDLTITPLTAYDITCSATNGTVTPSSTTAVAGSTVTLTFAPSEGYVLKSCTATFKDDDNVQHDIDATAGSFIMPSEDVTVTAEFVASYTVTCSASNGTVTASPTTAYEGQTVTLTNEAASGYAFSAYEVKDASDNTITVTDGKFTMPASNVSVTGTFVAAQYTVTCSEVSNGTLTASTTGANAGETVTFTVTPNINYSLTTFTVNDIDVTSGVSADGTYVYTMPAGNVKATATFTKNTTNLVFALKTSGTIDTNRKYLIVDQAGTSATSATLMNSAFTSATGTRYGGADPVADTEDITNKTITTAATNAFTFASAGTSSYYIINNAGTYFGTTSGASSSASEYYFNVGSSLTNTVSFATLGYALIRGNASTTDALGYDTSTKTGASYAVNEFYYYRSTANRLYLYEEIDGYTITTNAGEGGIIRPNLTSAENGTTITFNVTTNGAYRLKDNSVVVTDANGATIATTVTDDTYSFTMPSSNVTISAEFTDLYDGNIVTLKCTGTNVSGYYVYNNENEIGTTTTTPSSDADTKYEFVLIKGTNGGYTLQSVSNPSLYLSVNSSNNMYLSTTATEFSFVKSATLSTDNEGATMTGYALQYTYTDASGVSQTRVVAINNSGNIDHLDYTTENYNNYSTDFTIKIIDSYKITCATVYGGTLKTDLVLAVQGTTVTATANPCCEHSNFVTWSVKEDVSGNAVTIDADGTFTMPAADVTVYASFAEPITISKYKYATYTTWHALDFSSTAVTAYKMSNIDLPNKTVTISDVNPVPENTPLVVKTTEEITTSTTYNIPIIGSADAITGNELHYSDTDIKYENIPAGSTYYIMVVQNGQVVWAPANSGTLAARKCYFEVNPSPAKLISFSFVIDDATPVQGIATEKSENDAIYNISGQRVDASYKGIIIKNGQKYYNK